MAVDLGKTVRDILSGRTEAIGQFAVRKSNTTTTVVAPRCAVNSWVGLMPLDATTATEYGLGTTYVTPGAGQFIVTHPSNTDDRTYRYVIHFGIRT